jgi:hypothetical protein
MSVLLKTLLLIALATPYCAEAQPLLLRQHWQAGRAYTLDTTTQTEVKDVKNSSMTVQQVTELWAEQLANKSTALKVTFLASKATVTAEGKTLSYDSKDQANSHPALVGSLGKSQGKSFTLIYDEKDRFKEVRDLSSLAAEPGVAPGLQAVEESKNVAILFRKSIEMGLPAVPVEVGSTWTADDVLTLASVGEVHADITGKLLKVEEKAGRKQAIISFDGLLLSTKKGVASSPMAIDLAEGSTINGTLHFDLDQRLVTEFTGVTKLALNAAGRVVHFEMKETRTLSPASKSK